MVILLAIINFVIIAFCFCGLRAAEKLKKKQEVRLLQHQLDLLKKITDAN
jgi:large-conductance mechanosensitive channel